MSGAPPPLRARPRVVLATRNAGKIAEITRILTGLDVTFVPVAEIPALPEVEETGVTLEANARQKAEAVAKASGEISIADDTGLEVEALGGAPGVRSARFAGPEADDALNRRKLLAALAGVPPPRRARFRTVVAIAAAGRESVLVEGSVAGGIASSERGRGGFGYDALFLPAGSDRTFAEMSIEEKNRTSHRARAFEAARETLRRFVARSDA